MARHYAPRPRVKAGNNTGRDQSSTPLPGRRRRPIPLSPLLLLQLLLVVSSYLPPSVDATVTVLSDKDSRSVASYPSRPADFGNTFEFGLEYVSRVQLPPDDDLWLCGGADREVDEKDEVYENFRDDDSESGFSSLRGRMDGGGGAGGGGDGGGLRDAWVRSRGGLLVGDGPASDPSWLELDDGGAQGKVVVPPDGMPVAILARRGNCSYETKARTATSLLPQGTVRYVIVYDDVDEDRLIEMASESGSGRVDGVNVGLLFISKKSGEDLLRRINRQSPETRAQGGPRVLLDSFTRWLPGGGAFDPLSWMGTILLAFACLLSCSCLFVTESVRTNGSGQVVAVRRRDDVVLLTEEEVRTLPEVIYRGPDPYGPTKTAAQGDDTDDADAAGDWHGDGNASEPKDGRDDDNAATSTTAADAKPESKADDEDRDGQDVKSPLIDADSKPDQEAAALTEPSLQDTSLHEKFDNTACSICLEEYHAGCRLRVLPCHHAFHSDCILPWLTERSPTCPLCKAEFEGAGRDEDDSEDGSESSGDGRDDANSRAVASMLGLELETVGTPMVTRRRIDDDEESEALGQAADHGFWRFLTGRRRVDEEETTAQEAEAEVEEGSVEPRPRPGRFGEALAALGNSSGAAVDSDAAAAEQVHAELREPLLDEQEEESPPTSVEV